MADRDPADPVRRTLLAAGGGLAGGLGLAVLPASAAPRAAPAAPIDEGRADGAKVTFDPIHDPATERPEGQPPNPDAPDKRIGFAVLGLGRLALQNIIPALAQGRRARLTALVSGDADKLKTVAAQHGVAPEHCYSYADFDRIKSDAQVQVVYVVTPNALHREWTLRAAKAGKHVMCEKPMATSVADARDMVQACRDAKRLLMVAYRCQYQPHAREAIRLARGGSLGDVTLMDMVNNQNQGDPGQWRQKKALAGGGALPDIGLYCLNGFRAVLGEEPVEVTASIGSPRDDPRFAEVEANVAFTLRFPSGALATGLSSYASHEHRRLTVLGPKGAAVIENAFAYEGQQLFVSRKEGEAEARTQVSLAHHDQFSLEIDHFAECVRANRTPRTPGEEGLQDQRIMEAIYESARTRRPVPLAAAGGRDAFRGAEPSPPG